MVYSVISRENAVAAVDTPVILTELGANSPGTIDVPQATLLTGIKISVAMDWTADDDLGFSTAIRLSGSGISGYQSYPGPCGYTASEGATASSGLSVAPPQSYKVRIPVIPGQGIDTEGFMHGEDAGELHLMVSLEFDGIPGMIKDMDYREENLAAANTPVILGAKLGAAHPYILPSTLRIGEIHVNGGFKAVAGPLAAPTLFELFGAALASGGVYEFAGHAYAAQDDLGLTTGGSGGTNQVNSIVYPIPPGKLILKSGNKFRARAQMIEDDAGTVFAIIGIGYL